MAILLFVGSLLSGFSTWILFLAVVKIKNNNSKVGDLHTELIETPQEDGPSYGDLLASATKPVQLVIESAESKQPLACLVLDIVLMLYGLGAVVTYFLFLSNFVQQLPFWPHQIHSTATIILVACFVFPLTLFESVGRLARFASMGIIALSIMVLGIWIRLPHAAQERSSPLEAFGDMSRFPAVLCICIYAFMWHTNCVTVARELYNPTPFRCAAVSFGSTTLLCIVYGIIAAGGFVSWGTALEHSSSIVDMYSKDDPLFIIIRIALSGALLIASPVNLYPVRESLVGLMRRCAPGFKLGFRARVGLSAILVGTITIIAIIFPQVVAVITLLGGTLAACLMFVFPAMIAKIIFGKGPRVGICALNFGIATFLVLSALGFIGRPL